MSTDQKIAAVKDAILEFNWWNYGLDKVSETPSNDWAIELAESIVAALEPKKEVQS